jgi:hypothetical protein
MVRFTILHSARIGMIVALGQSTSVNRKEFMPARMDIRRVSLTMAIVVAMISIALPLCQAIVCDMGMGSMSSSHMGTGFSGACDLGVMTSTAPAGVVPPGSQSLLLSLAMFVVMALVTVFPPRQLRLIRAVAEDPPAPPEDPRGVRLII